MDSTVTVIATATATATSTSGVSSVISGIGTVTGWITGITSFLGAGPVGWGLAGGAALLIGILFFIFKAQILKILQSWAQAATNAANQAAAAAAAAKAAQQEAEMQSLQAQLNSFASSEKKLMLDALSLTQLESYATQAYGAAAVNAILSQSSNSVMPALQIRVGIYQLYGLATNGATGVAGATGVQP